MSNQRNIADENLSGLPLNQEWQRLLVEMIGTGVSEGDAVETMLTTALGNMISLYGPQKVVASMLRLNMGMLESMRDEPGVAH